MIKIANAPCSWGILEFDIKNNSNYKRVLDEIKECNYSGTELGDYGFLPTHPAVLKRELNKRNLSLVGAFIQIALSKKNITLPKDSSIKIEGNQLMIKGPKGSKTLSINEKIFSSKVNQKKRYYLS